MNTEQQQAAFDAAFTEVASEVLRRTSVGDEGDEFLHQYRKHVNDVVTNVWVGGLTHDEWVDLAMGRV